MPDLKLYFSVLKNQNFVKLWISQITSQLTNYILSFAILIKVFQQTGSTFSVSLIIVAFGLATVIFGSLGGVYADKFDRRLLLTSTNFLQAATIALYFFVGGHFWGLVLITFLYSSLNQFYIPVEAPTIPNLVSKNQVLTANSYFAFTNSSALILGFAIAGPLSSSLGQAAPFAAGVALLIIAGLATLSLPPIHPEIETEHSLAQVWSEFKEGIEYFWNNTILHYPLLSLVSIQIINGMVITIAPAFMKEAIGVDLNTGPIFVIAPLGLGILTGALLLPYEEKTYSKQRLVLFGFIGMGVVLILLSFIEHFSIRYLYYTILGFILGIFNAHIFAPSHSILQLHALSNIRGRVYGSLYVLLQMAGTLPTVLVGLVADHMPLTYIVTILGILLLIFAALIHPRTKPNFGRG